MTDRPPESDVDPDAEWRHDALIGLHVLSGAYGEIDTGVLPGFRPISPAAALRAVAEAPDDEIPLSARVAVLHDLARARFPHRKSHEAEYMLLAASVADRHGLDASQLITDVAESVREGIPFRSTATGRQLPLSVAAFVGEQVCTTKTVQVGGLAATWIFSEFDTDAPFDHVAAWVDPRNWPERGPMLFKRMDLVGGGDPVKIGSLGDEHWHGAFLEEVRLVTRVKTLLHCDFWREGQQAAGMTYELDFSVDGEIDVDRGFLSVNDLGPVRRVKALKIVGFTENVWDRVARLVCPFWTDWVRAAAEGGTTTTPRPPSHAPTGEAGSWSALAGETLGAWVDFFGDSAQTYLALFGDVASRATSTDYSRSDWVEDGTRYWSQLAKDWARAWTYGLELLDEVAREGVDASFMPPGRGREAGRGTATAMSAGVPARTEEALIPVAGLAATDRPVCSDLVSIEDPASTIPSLEVVVGLEAVDDATYGVRLSTANKSVPPGLYVGSLASPLGGTISGAQLYVSRATEAPRP